MKTLTNKTITAAMAAAMLTTVAMPLAATSAAAQCLTGDPARDYIDERARMKIVEILQVHQSEINLESVFTDDLGADSLDVVEIILAIDDEFGIYIPDEDAQRITTFGDLTLYIRAHCE